MLTEPSPGRCRIVSMEEVALCGRSSTSDRVDTLFALLSWLRDVAAALRDGIGIAMQEWHKLTGS